MTNATPSDWRPLGGMDLARLREARLQAHYAAQWLARAARAFIPPQPDDGHTNLGWDAAIDGFAGRALPGGSHLALNLPELMLVILDHSTVLVLDGKTDPAAHAWLDNELGRRGLDVSKLDARLPYAMPAHMLRTGAAYRADRGALTELAAWFANANAALTAIRAHCASSVADASAVRCWPHHFDVATLLTLRGEPARYVGAGLSPGDEHYDEPYFYVNLWPHPEASRLPPLGKLGHWHTQDFTAAIATASDILKASDRQAAGEGFLRTAVDAAMKVMG